MPFKWNAYCGKDREKAKINSNQINLVLYWLLKTSRNCDFKNKFVFSNVKTVKKEKTWNGSLDMSLCKYLQAKR